MREERALDFERSNAVTACGDHVIGPAVMFTKMLLITFVIYWVRFTYPRFREDQLQKFAWKVLIPLSLVNIAITGALKVAF